MKLPKTPWKAAGPVLTLGIAGVLAAGAPPPQESQEAGAAQRRAMVLALEELLGSPDAATLRTQASARFDDAERRTWAFGPVERLGVHLGELGDDRSVEPLLDTVLSEEGLTAFRQIRELEHILRRRETRMGRPPANRDADLYWLRVYGEPGLRTKWGWRLEGHHFVLHVACAPGEVPTVTPLFLGASPLSGVEPDEWRKGIEPRSGVTVELFANLETVLEVAVDAAAGAPLTSGKPKDVRMGPGTMALPKKAGWKVNAMKPEAQDAITNLVRTFEGLLDPHLRAGTSGALSADARFCAWSADRPGEHAWCVSSGTYLLEFSTTTGADHVHLVLRDVARDFGGPEGNTGR